MKSCFFQIRRSLVAVTAAGLLATSPASAQTQTKADNTNALNLGASYVSGTAPTASDTVIFDTTLASNRSASPAGVSVYGLNFTSGTNIFTFSSGTLNLGAGGLTKNDTSPRTIISSNFVLTTSQTWTINSSILRFDSATAAVTTGSHALLITSTSGTGSIAFSGSANNLTLGPNITIGDFTTGAINPQGGSAVTFLGSNTFNTLLINGNATLTGNTIGDFGVASAFGDGGTNTTITLGQVGGAHGTLIYSGTTTSSNRSFTRTSMNAGVNVPWSAGIEVSTPGQTLTLSGSFIEQNGTTGNSGWRFGGAGNLTIQSAILETATTGNSVSVLKDGSGTLRLSGSNLYQGATTVQAGVLLVDGSTTSASAVSVSAAAVIGGNGTIGGNLTLANGAFFAFDPLATLDLSGTLALDPSFGVMSLRTTSGSGVDWAAVATGTYTPLNTTFSFGTSTISNFGVANQQTGLAGGKSAYFQQGAGSLQLVVVPEPTTIALLGSAGVAACAGWLRRRRNMGG